MKDPKVDAAIAAGRVPDGITADFLNESKDNEAIAGILFVTIFSSIFVLGRLYSRILMLRRGGIDDYIALASWILFIPFVGLCIHLIRLGSGRHFEYIMYVLDMPTILDTEVLDFVAHIIYTVSLLLCRLSGLALYYRLCSTHPRLLLAIKTVFAVIIMGFVPQLFLLIFHCLPVTALWPYDFQPGHADYTCLQWGVVYSVNSGVSLLCDFLVFGIPIFMLRVLKMSSRRKVELACILLPGIFVVGISVARLVLVIQGQWNADMSWAYNPMLGIEVSEIGATLIALSVPGGKPLWDVYVLRRPLIDSDDQSGGATGPFGTGGSSKRTRLYNTSLRSLDHRLRPDQMVLQDRDTTVEGRGKPRTRSQNGSRGDQHSDHSSDGILVKVDFRVKEGHTE